MDSDLAEAVSALKEIFGSRRIPASFGRCAPPRMEELRKALRLPSRYRAFLTEADPLDVETVTPVERVRLVGSDRLLEEQVGFGLGDATTPPHPAWKKSWVLIARSSLLGDPYFLDLSRLDAEGDCPVLTAMTGTDALKPVLCASSFAQFLRLLATGMEVARGFGEAALDDEDDATFREAFGPQVKAIDSAAHRAGHWH